jgi:hypothetical protein
MGPLSPWLCVASSCRQKRHSPNMEGNADVLNRQLQIVDEGWSSSLEF